MASITPEEFKEKMEYLAADANGGGCLDIEQAHIEADDLMCKILWSLGYDEGIAIFKGMGKYYI